VTSHLYTVTHDAEQIKWLETSVIPTENPNKRVFSIRQPRGVYAIVTPWNFPINIPAEYLAPGLAAGNAIVWVPAPTTSVCAVKLMECLEEAGVPVRAVNLVTGPGPVVGDEIVAHPGTDAVGFTGSARTGKLIAGRAAGHIRQPGAFAAQQRAHFVPCTAGVLFGLAQFIKGVHPFHRCRCRMV
jgi:acyl-CoA reductase-like NAD-dependent aldehyde dehydrogenase